jgi:pilus assembly protein CpaB
MNQRFLAVLLFAVLVAGAASYLVYSGVSAHIKAAPRGPTARLVVAARDLEVGTLLTESDVHEVDWAGTIPAQFVRTKEEIVGRGVITQIYKDEAFIAGRLAAKGAGAGMAATIPVGMRAVALRVNDVIGLAGYVLPGMHVDVIVSGNAPQAQQAGTVSRTILQNIEVLSAGQKIERTTDGKPEDAQVVNLLVTPDEAEVLSLASSETKVQLVLRNPMDTKNMSTHGASVAGLFGGVPAPAAIGKGIVRPAKRLEVQAVAARDLPQPATIEVFSGSKRTEASFSPGGSK